MMEPNVKLFSKVALGIINKEIKKTLTNVY